MGCCSEYSEVAPGVLSLQALSSSECSEVVHAATVTGIWTQADITNYNDAGMLDQYVDLEARNVQVKGPATIPKLCARYVELLEQQAKPILKAHWGLSGLRVSGPQLAKYDIGSHIRIHNDTATEYSARCVSTVLYLNSEYTGGELLFPRLGRTYRPSVGELILFPSEYLHAVLPVLSGVRYCFVAFFLAEAFGSWPDRLMRHV